MRLFTHRVALAAVIGSLLLSASAFADWPTQRHDPSRTGLATGTSDLVNPAVYFRYYLGGSLNGLALLPHDVDGDGARELVYLSGGSVVAKRSNDEIVWKTSPGGYAQLLSVSDMDGDKQDDIAVHTRAGVVILDAATGAVRWKQPSGQMGTLGRAVVDDIDGDGLDDVVTQECACCGTVSGNTGYAFSFASGFAAAQQLWELPHAACGGYISLTLLDSDGQAPLEVLNADESSLHLLDGTSGQVLATSDPLGSWTQSHACRGHDIDGIPGEEILCLLNRSTLPATNQRKVTVLKRKGSKLDVLWSATLAPDDGGDVSYVDPFTDLNGDGTLEVVVASKSQLDVWTTRIFNAKTGTELASLQGEELAGIAPIEEANSSVVLTSNAGTMSAYVFDGASLTLRWKLNDRIPLLESQRALARRSSLSLRTVTLDLDGDGVDELLTLTPGSSEVITAYKASTKTPQEIASYALPSDVNVFGLWALPPIDTSSPQLGVAQNDGLFMVLDSLLFPTPLGLTEPGVRIGGYYAAGTWGNLQTTPIVGALDGAAEQSVIVPDSRGALLRLDAASASLASPPKRAWEKTKTRAASIVAGLDGGAPGIVSFARQQPLTNPPLYRLAAWQADGGLLFDVALDGLPLRDIMPGDINQDGTPDLLFHWGEPQNTLLRTRAVDGTNGATLWDAAPIEPQCGRQPAGLTVRDFNGDGRSDVLHHAASQTHVLDGQDGSVTLSGLYVGGCYSMVTVYDTDSDQKPEHLLHASNYGPTTLENDLKTLRWTTPLGGKHYPYGAVAPCSSGPVLVAGSWAQTAELSVIPTTGPKAGESNKVVLAGGQIFPTQAAAESAGAYLGQLTTVNVHSNLTGLGRPTAVLGSSDGWLYAIDPCALTLDFAMDFSTAVGEVVFGDTDGDGRDELILTAADGYLYGVKHAYIDAPHAVVDTNPDEGIEDDIDARPNAGRLSASWQSVDGATSYHVAVVDELGAFLTTPAWTDVGQVTEHTVSELQLDNNRKYLFAVRAIHSSGNPSVDALSDGVTVYTDTMTTTSASGAGGAGGAASNVEEGGSGPTSRTRHLLIDNGCGCRLRGNSQSPNAWFLLALFGSWGLFFARRRHTNDERRHLAKRKRRLPSQ